MPRSGQMILRLPRPPSLVMVVALTLATLACASIETLFFSTPNSIATRTPWPTFTPTAASTSLARAMPAEPPVASPTRAPLLINTPASPAAAPATPTLSPIVTSAPAVASTPSETPVSTDTSPTSPPSTTADTLTASPTPRPVSTPTVAASVTSVPETPDWSFADVRVHTDQDEGGLRLYGNVINDAGSSQELVFLTGTFYDAQGQIIADEGSTYGYSPIFVIPPGGHVPFELRVEDIQSAANFNLRVEAQPSSETPRQDFEFSDLYQTDEEDTYCVGGTIYIPGSELQDFLAIVAVLYNSQDNVINFSDYYAYVEGVLDGQTLDFEICVDSLNQDVARYELQAWGQ